MTQHPDGNIQPVIQNRYIVGGKYSNHHVLYFISRVRAGKTTIRNFPQKKSLIEILRKEGFSIDQGEGESLTAMRNDRNGVDAYLKGFRRIKVTIKAPERSPGMDPDYLKGLVGKIERAGFKVTEIEGAKRVNPYRPYDWDKRRDLLVGYGQK